MKYSQTDRQTEKKTGCPLPCYLDVVKLQRAAAPIGDKVLKNGEKFSPPVRPIIHPSTGYRGQGSAIGL